MKPNKSVELKLSVVIVSYNSQNTILSTLEPLYKLYNEGYLEVIIIDNHNNDGVKELLNKNCPWVVYKSLESNLGFGYGCNAGFAIANSEYTLFLNPDAVIEQEAIYELVNLLDMSPQIAITAPATKVSTGLQAAGMMLEPKLKNIFSKRKSPEKRLIIPNEPPFCTSWLCGAILLIRSSIFSQIGGFDERFFLYFEETDLCKRMTDAGYELWANGIAVAEHSCGESSRDSGEQLIVGCISEHYYKSRYYFLKKHYGWCHAFADEIIDVLQIFSKSIPRAILGRSNPFKELYIRLKSPFLSEP